MAHMDYFRKYLGCRLLMLLLWTIFVCCVLYASRESKLPDISPDLHSERLPLTRHKRSKNESLGHDQGQCGEVPLTREDFKVMRRLFSSRKQHPQKSIMHCSVVRLCNADFRADCYSRECSSYQIRMIETDHLIPSLSTEELSEIVGTGLKENSFMTVEDMNRYIHIHCQDSVETKLELTGEVFSGGNCKKHESKADNDNMQVVRTSKKNIHVLYFRFLSQLELQFRFPGLFSLLDKYESEGHINVLSFDKHQATTWGDDEILSTLLQGKTGQFRVKGSLLGMLKELGYCFRIEDLSCSRSREQEILLANITSAGKSIACQGNPFRHRKAIMERLCMKENLTETKMRIVLTSLLYNTHELQVDGSESRPVFSLSLLNIKDYKRPEFMDYVLRNFFLKVNSMEDSVILLVSGVGNPSFLRFDHNVRLELQASNPVLMMSSTEHASALNYGDLSQSLFSIQNVHHLIKSLIKKGDKFPKFRETIDSGGMANYETNTCESLGVNPPFRCLCEQEFVPYENDTLMAGFAEFAVGIINARLGQLPPVSGDNRESALSSCARLSGVSFSNVRFGRFRDRTRILINLNLVDSISKDEVFRRVVLDIWDMDKIPKAELHFHNQDNGSPQILPLPLTYPFLKTMCRTGENLAFPLASERDLLEHWSQERHFGRKGTVTHVHDTCLCLFVRDYGDSFGVEAANLCRDRRYEVTLHLSLINMISLNSLPLSVSLGHAQRKFMAAIVKVSYTVTTFAYKLDPDFDVIYDD